ncbi:uncharacterized protein LOC143252573 isoform X2 [Tachypleus tridentatus]
MFSCIDQFGYHPDPGDCSKYFVCVFGEPLHESCTGGLYFSTELQTCDWPRNTKCAGGGSQTKAEEADHGVLPNSGDVLLSQTRELDSSHEGNSNYGERRTSGIVGGTNGIPQSNTLRPDRTWPSTIPPLINPPPNPAAVQTSPVKPSYQDPYNNVPGGPEQSSRSDKSNYNTLYSISQVNPQDPPQYFEGVPSVVASNKKTFGGTDQLPDAPDLSVFVKSVFQNDGTHENTAVDHETHYTNNNHREFKTLHPIDHNNGHSKDPDTIPYPASMLNKRKLSSTLENFENTDVLSNIKTNNGNHKDPDTILVHNKSPNNYRDTGGPSIYNDNRGTFETLFSQSNNNRYHDDRGTLSIYNRNNDKHKNSDVIFTLSKNNGHSKDPDTDLPLSRNNGHYDDPDTIPLLSTNNGHSKDPDIISPLSTNNDRYKAPDTISSLSTNNGHSKDPDTIPSFSTNNGHPKDSDTIPRVSSDEGHSKDVDVVPALASNNGHYKDPDVRFLASASIPPPEESKNLHPAYGPKQTLQSPGSIDAQFDTSPSIISLSDTHNQRNYNYPSDKKITSTQKFNAPGAGDISVSNDPTQLFNYRSYNDPYQYNYEYYEDYEPTDPTPPFNVESHNKSTNTTTSNPPVVITSSSAQKSFNSTSLYPARPSPVYPTPAPLVKANECNPSKCLAPDCRCGGIDIPGGLPVSETPQVLLLTFDDAINDLNFDLYKEIFSGRKNPNGCPIHGTFYISHEWTDYGEVQTLYSQGHEIASHTISHSYGEKFSKNKWFKEIQGQREILHLYGGVKMEDIRGMRAPFLQIGGNPMFEMLFEANFTYDSSMPVFENDPPFWPFTLDYAINNECMITPCPNESFPGLWEMAMVMWVDLKGGRCSMADACSNPQDEQGIVEFLKKNFNRHYNSNRAPLGLFFHSAWFTTAHHKKGLLKFLDEVLSKGDVWLVTNWQLIQWLRNPTPKSKLKSFEPWQCKRQDLPPPCHNPTVCNVWDKNGIRYMKTCQQCPSHYPWVGRTGYKKDG